MKRHPILVSVACIPVLYGCLGGCGSMTLPPELTRAQSETVATERIPLSVGVERYKWPAHSDALLRDLRRSKVFVRVDHVDKFAQPPDLIARVEEPMSGQAIIPLVTGVTLGLVPTAWEEEVGTVFSLASPRARTDPVHVAFGYKGRAILGWYAMFLNLSPDRSAGDVHRHRRYRKALASALLQQRQHIQAITRDSASNSRLQPTKPASHSE